MFVELPIMIGVALAGVILLGTAMVWSWRSEGRVSILDSICYFATPIGIGAVAIFSAVVFSASLDSIWPHLQLSPSFGLLTAALACMFIGPPMVCIQLAILWYCSRKHYSWHRRYGITLSPALVLSLLMAIGAIWYARPAARFHQLVGVSPPPSARDIVYTRTGDPFFFQETVQWTMPLTDVKVFITRHQSSLDAISAEPVILRPNALHVGEFSIVWRDAESIRLQAETEFDF